MFLFSAKAIAQDPVCGTVSPTALEYQIFVEQAAIERQIKGFNPNQPFTLKVPVRVTVALDDNGMGANPSLADIDAMLLQASNALSQSGKAIIFERCDGITKVKSSLLTYEDLFAQLTEHSFIDHVVNVYVIIAESGRASTGTFPYHIPASVVHLRGYDGNIQAFPSAAIHELGHTIGLFHTHQSSTNDFFIPSTPARPDYPGIINGDLNPNGRELVIRDNDINKYYFRYANAEKAGDRVKDTPPGCDPTKFAGWRNYPILSNIAPGCFDNDASTPCFNACTDNNPNTVCTEVSACSFTDCNYTGTYRDYNLDLIQDPTNILARNFMSYTGGCRNSFTPGQNQYIIDNFGVLLQGRFRTDVCGSMADQIEWEGTNSPVTHVKMSILAASLPSAKIKALANEDGSFFAMIPTYGGVDNLFASLTKYRPTDIRVADNSWLTGVNLLDVLSIQRHILGLQPLQNGYKVLAADVNKSSTITSSDIVELRKLILGAYTKLPAFDFPWLFIPEAITHLNSTSNLLQNDFDGLVNPSNGLFDNPFSTVAPMTGLVNAISPYDIANGSNTTYGYLSSSFPIRSFKYNTSLNGFDVVKMGDVTSTQVPTIVPEPEPCDENYPAILPTVRIVRGQKYQVDVIASNAANVSALQMEIKLDSAQFAWGELVKTDLPDVGDEEVFVGGLRNQGNNLKLLWLKENGGSTNLTSNQSLASFTVVAKDSIENVQDVISVVNQVFVNDQGYCVNEIVIQINIKPVIDSIQGSSDRETMAALSNTHLRIVPNPLSTKGYVYFDADTFDNGLLQIVDAQGVLVSTEQISVHPGTNALEIRQLGELKSGLYAVVLQLDSQTKSATFIKHD